MRKIKESSRTKIIENRWKVSIENLLYKWHWDDNLRHREIGTKLNIPRPTITRWFKQLEVPTQSCTRFTNNNLLYVGPNCPLKKSKPPKKPKERIPVNEDFFRSWSPEMAYILGYFTADGCMFINPRGSCYIGFYSTDYELLSKVREILNSKHKIASWLSKNPKRKTRYQIQIGSKKMYQDLIDIGLMPNKSKVLKLPKIPKTYFRHFTRGYFDGDGCVFFNKYQRKTRKSPVYVIMTMLTAGNRRFLKDIFGTLQKYAYLKGGTLYQKKRGFELRFSTRDTLRLYEFMYKNVPNSQFLERKYNIFQKILTYKGT